MVVSELNRWFLFSSPGASKVLAPGIFLYVSESSLAVETCFAFKSKSDAMQYADNANKDTKIFLQKM